MHIDKYKRDNLYFLPGKDFSTECPKEFIFKWIYCKNFLNGSILCDCMDIDEILIFVKKSLTWLEDRDKGISAHLDNIPSWKDFVKETCQGYEFIAFIIIGYLTAQGYADHCGSIIGSYLDSIEGLQLLEDLEEIYGK